MNEIFDTNGLKEELEKEFSVKEPEKSNPEKGKAALDLARLEDELRAKNIIGNIPVRPDAKSWLALVDSGTLQKGLEKFCLHNIKPMGINIAEISQGEGNEELVLYGRNETGGTERFTLAARNPVLEGNG